MTWLDDINPSFALMRSLTGGVENDTALVVDFNSGKNIVLRRTIRRTMDAVECEADFILAASMRGIKVAVPLPVFNGSCALQLDNGIVSAFAYVVGEKRTSATTQDVLSVTRLIEPLHRAGTFIGPDPRRFRKPFHNRIHNDLAVGLRELCSSHEAKRLHAVVDAMYEYSYNNAEGIVHGDLHPGNILWSQCGIPTILDFDDCYRGSYVDELFAFARGYGFSGSDPRFDILRRVLADQACLGGTCVAGRLAAECGYFYSAMLDSAERAGISPGPDHLQDLHRALACLRMPDDWFAN